MASNNAPEKWAAKFMNNAEMGNIIPIKHHNENTISKMNLYLPSQGPYVKHYMPELGRMGTLSGLGMLPNLTKKLNTGPKLSASAKEFTPPPPTPPPTSFVSAPMLLDYMKQGGRVYINNYPPHLQDQVKNIMRNYRQEYDIHLFYLNRRTGDLLDKPYYYIGHKTSREPLSPLGQTRRRRIKKRKSTRHTRR
jgi:hypothetical protein